MRGRRIKVSPEEGSAVYHCISRTVNGEFLFAPEDREILRKQIWLVAEFCGVQVLTYTILSNHFHVLVQVPKAEPIPDEELFRRYAVLYPSPTKYQTARLAVIKSLLQAGDPEGVKWRHRMLRLMGDVSSYLKLLKQRFSIAFNKRHKRYGTLWAERFKSLLLGGGVEVRAVAAYIDLNCVRAGLVLDPKEYRFCGYAEAVAGKHVAQLGLERVMGENWKSAAPAYRQWLFGIGADPMSTKGRIPEAVATRVIEQHGHLGVHELLRCRIRYFTDGAVLGSRSFVEAILKRSLPGLRPTQRERQPRPLSAEGPLSALCVLRMDGRPTAHAVAV